MVPGLERTPSVTKVPTYDKLLWPTLLALKALGGSGSIQEIEAKVAQLAGFTDQQLSVPHQGKVSRRWSEISYRQAWARTYLRKAGAVENSARGVSSLTARGRAMTEAEVAAIPAQVRREDALARKERGPEPAENGTEAPEEPDEAWRDRLLQTMEGIPPDAFERLCQRVLREAGFSRVEVTGRSGDGGIDGIGVLGLSLVSCPHRYPHSVRTPKDVGVWAVRGR